MNKKYLFVLSIIGLFIIAGCGEEEAPTVKSPYIGGNQGVLAEFEPMGIEEAGVYTIYDDETFPIQILLKNKGEEAIAPGQAKVKLYGILLSDFSGVKGSELTNTETIEKISDINKEGGELIIDFGPDIQYLPAIQGEFVPLDIFVSYTYRYKTKTAVPKVCFVEDFRDTEVCNVDEKKTAYSSAAPIQISSVEEKPAAAGKVSLVYEVENIGGGDAAIPGQDFNVRYDQIQYKIIPSAEAANWKCAAAGREDQARFADAKATIVCTLVNPLPEGAKYTKEIVLEIEYDYRDVIQESLRVRRSI